MIPDMGTTLATKQEVTLLRQEMLGIRARCKLEPGSGSTQLLGSLDKFYYDFTRKLAEFERKLTIRFGVMFFSGCALTVAAARLWV